ncbi:MAG: DNA double-strand break repair nuclease NurA [Candidatus Latescibacteria bacterium]|nr:DNA double-strand break repair nuclease NurA [Candidatus Latescibacterota bacterium]
MLDLGAVKRQIDRMAADQKRVQNDFFERIDLSVREARRWSEDWKALSHGVDVSRTSWLVARLSGPPDAACPAPERPKHLTVIAADGSQIFPDRHEISSCYLLNVGYVVIHYGTGERPTLSSRPFLYYREEDLYEEWEGRRSMVTRESVGIRRGAMEFTFLADLSLQAREEGRSVVGLSDGTLILWSLEGRPPDLRAATLKTYLDAFERMRQARVPVAGYISSPGSADVINALRVGLCPEEPTNCDRCPWKVDAREPLLEIGQGLPPALPCGPIEGVTDDLLFARLLKPGERSGVFRSQSKILNDYGPHRICFFYLHTGAEIARVEVPQWVVDDPELLDLTHACIVDQAEKGKGYPIVLSEAHEKAIVRGADRDLFYKFLRDTFVQNDIRAEISLKSLKKLAATV